ncbi:MAG TPA: PhoH family protein [candidate division Zixibacteria bacterium]|nr:PhoH family protein [candidate division Zixibacteria bacterium]
MPRKKKIFVIDTNVILYDHTAIYNFQEHDVVIPIVVLEELDKFKKGNDLINFEAREFVRKLDKIAGDKLFTKGVSLGKGLGKLFIEVSNFDSKALSDAFIDNKPDHRILALAANLRDKHGEGDVILISKDINLRMKAKSLGIPAEDYETGKIANIDELYTGHAMFDGFDKELISRFYQEPFSVPVGELELPQIVPNQYFILRNRSQSVLAYYNPREGIYERVNRINAYGIEPRNAEQTFALDALNRPEIQLVTMTGKAGTGKTLLALAAAIHQRKRYRQIYLARPIVPLGNRDLGYLPGDVSEKLAPYMQPLYDNLAVIRHKYPSDSLEFAQIDQMINSEKLTISPLAYIRGRSLEKIFFIVDEAQNLTPHEVKTIITRAGEGAKIVFTGDIYQIDTPYLDSRSNGLTYLIDRMKGQELFGHVTLFKGERSELAELASDLL